MISSIRKPLSDYFDEGLQARQEGKRLRDNPYCAGSEKRNEWDAGFEAKLDFEEEDRLSLDPNDNSEIRSVD